MKRVYITTALTALVLVLGFGLWARGRGRTAEEGLPLVGFLYEDDESTPYTYNFALGEEALKESYHDRIRIISKSNVPSDDAEEPLRDLVQEGCRIIFTNSHSEEVLSLAPLYPEVQFCQVSRPDELPETLPDNYHSFRGGIEEGRYLSGVIAGMKLKELIESGRLSEEDAWIGYVGSYPSSALISGYTAFFSGVRSEVPGAALRVRYTNTWGNYAKEKEAAEELIDEGCVIISHHTDTSGPAAACEESEETVYFVGYNRSMLDLAPTTALISTRINWAPYITQAVGAVLENRPIESYVTGHADGHEMSAGIAEGWVELQELNTAIAAPGSGERLAELTDAIAGGRMIPDMLVLPDDAVVEISQ